MKDIFHIVPDGVAKRKTRFTNGSGIEATRLEVSMGAHVGPSGRDAQRADAPERLAGCYRPPIVVDDDELTVRRVRRSASSPPLT